MKLVPLGQGSYLVTFRKTTLLLECGVDLDALTHFWPLDQPPPEEPEGGEEAADGAALPGGAKRLKREQGGGEGGARAPPAGRRFVRCGDEVFVRDTLLFRTAALDAVDLSAVNAILVSEPAQLLGLPFVTEFSAFRGQVYAPEPVIAIAQQWAQELLDVDRAYRARHPPPPPCGLAAEAAAAGLGEDVQQRFLPAASWRTLYSALDLEASLSKVRGLHHAQEVELEGGDLSVTPTAGGRGLGCVNWVVRAGERTLAYLGGAGAAADFVAAAPLARAPLTRADALLLPALAPGAGGGGGAPPAPRPNTAVLRQQLGAAVVAALDAHGSVLVPVHPAGPMLHLLDVLGDALAEHDRFAKVPIFYVAPAAQAVVAHASISMEWLAGRHQDRVFDGRAPFKHLQMQESGRLVVVPGLHAVQARWGEPCVVLVPHASTRAGAGAHLLRQWGGAPQHLLLLTEPSDSHRRDTDAMLAPFQPLRMQVLRVPLDARLTAEDAAGLLRELQPGTLLAAKKDAAALKRLPPEVRGALGTDALVTFDPAQRGPVSVPLPAEGVPATVSVELAQTVELVEMEGTPFSADGSCPRAARVSAHLVHRDGRYSLLPVERGTAAALQSLMRNKCVLWGQPQIEPLKAVLEQQGFDWVTLDSETVQSGAGVARDLAVNDGEEVAVLKVQLGADLGRIQLAANATHISSDSHVVRRLLLEAVLGQLHML